MSNFWTIQDLPLLLSGGDFMSLMLLGLSVILLSFKSLSENTKKALLLQLSLHLLKVTVICGTLSMNYYIECLYHHYPLSPHPPNLLTALHLFLMIKSKLSFFLSLRPWDITVNVETDHKNAACAHNGSVYWTTWLISLNCHNSRNRAVGNCTFHNSTSLSETESRTANAKIQTFSSSRVNPRPVRTRVWYLKVGQWTIGRKGPATGRGIIAAAFFLRWSRRRCLRAGWLNQHRTNLCQSLWKWPLGIILFPFPIFENLSSANHTNRN